MLVRSGETSASKFRANVMHSLEAQTVHVPNVLRIHHKFIQSYVDSAPRN